MRENSSVRVILQRLIRNRSALVGCLMFLLIVILALIGTRFTPYDPVQIDIKNRLAAPSSVYWLGSDHFGRDIFSRLLAGAHLSLLIGLVSVSLSVTVGLLLGLPSGYFGGWVDMLVMRLMDLMLSFPSEGRPRYVIGSFH